jgi:hypothetical protein
MLIVKPALTVDVDGKEPESVLNYGRGLAWAFWNAPVMRLKE